jgi:hypothetical protein
MKTSVRNRLVQASLLRIAARLEKFAVFRALGPSPAPFADLMLYPDKLEAVLEKVENWKQQVILAPKALTRVFQARMGRAKRGETGQRFDSPFKGLKNTEFHLEAPSAGSVKLAADFTDWEKSPLDLIKSEDGVWFTIVPLLPGSYAYRFIVDGQWCDDPQPDRRVVNPFGTTNAVVNVA